MSPSLRVIGTIGLVITCLLSAFIGLRWILYLCDISYRKIDSKITFHGTYMLLLLSTWVDIPMYIGLIKYNNQTLVPYSFHKLTAAALFGAFSVVISDWSSLLLLATESNDTPFLLRNGTLIGCNILLCTISLLNFIYCYLAPNMEAYLDSEVYIVGILIQVCVPVILTIVMLSTGLKLYFKLNAALLKGPTRGLLANRFSSENALLSDIDSVTASSKARSDATTLPAILFRFSFAMMMMAVAVTLQTIMVALNFFLGFQSKITATPGPPFLYYASNWWAPTCIISLCLLFLCHTKEANPRADISWTIDYSHHISSQEDLLAHLCDPRHEGRAADAWSSSSVHSIRENHDNNAEMSKPYDFPIEY